MKFFISKLFQECNIKFNNKFEKYIYYIEYYSIMLFIIIYSIIKFTLQK